MRLARGLVICSLIWLAACAPQLKPPGPNVREAGLTDHAFLTQDGANLPLHIWRTKEAPKAVILALHGFNDYGAFIKEGAAYFSARGVQVYAYDQRGFGKSPNFGFWPGREAFANYLKNAVGLLRRRHPGLPLYLVGASMGGAVIMTAMAGAHQPPVDGIVLAAPAVWGRSTMPFYQRWVLWLAAHTVPWMTLTGDGLGIRASDNDEMLRALGRDPLFIKETRVDTIWGLVNLMDLALESASDLRSKTLILYGEHDEVIRKAPTDLMLSRLPASAASRRRLIRYEQGYHMLLRDLQAKTVWRDILLWMGQSVAPN